MSRGWKIYAGVLALVTAVGISSGDDVLPLDVLIGVVGNLLVFVLLPWAVVQGVRKRRHRGETAR